MVIETLIEDIANPLSNLRREGRGRGESDEIPMCLTFSLRVLEYKHSILNFIHS